MADLDATLEKSKMEELIAKLKESQQGLKQNIVNLHQKLEMFDSKPEMQRNLEKFKVDVESRAIDL
jgi:hypothetical protein